MTTLKRLLDLCVHLNALIAILVCLYILVLPAALLIHDLRDPALTRGGTPRFVFRWHRSLSARYEKWAHQRRAEGAAPGLQAAQVSGTEWPLFGSVFYLRATEALQDALEADPTLSRRQPKDYARGAIQAAAALVADPNQATWVRQYWGKDYLVKENLFYRMMLISALTSYEKLTSDDRYRPLLTEQMASLAKELDDSPFGLLDDYPGQCYPIDVVAAIAAIRRADPVLGTDHSVFVKRAVRGFEGERLDGDTGLPGYVANSRTGRARDVARGIGLSFMLIWASELWPETAAHWYDRYEQDFWQSGPWFAGFREYARDIDVGWLALNDPDAGPVVAGYGTAACAFGITAARAMGRFDQAYPLTAEALVGSWPLPDGSLLGPRILSNATEAPYLGEATLLFIMAHHPNETPASIVPVTGRSLPRLVYVGIAGYAMVGLYGVVSTGLGLRRWHHPKRPMKVPAPQIQLALWATLMVTAIPAWILGHGIVAVTCLLCAQILPRCVRDKKASSEATPRPSGSPDST
jgi:hypothetical protein